MADVHRDWTARLVVYCDGPVCRTTGQRQLLGHALRFPAVPTSPAMAAIGQEMPQRPDEVAGGGLLFNEHDGNRTARCEKCRHRQRAQISMATVSEYLDGLDLAEIDELALGLDEHGTMTPL